MNKEFLELLEQMKVTHESKAQDYASSTNIDENFERIAIIQSWFKHDIDKAFAGMIAVKLARLATLLNKDGVPNNESVYDSFLDMTNYSALWAANYKRRTGYKLGEIKKITKEELERICTHGRYLPSCGICCPAE